MAYLVTYRLPTQASWYLHATHWTSDITRASRYATEADAQYRLDAARRFMKPAAYRAARIVPDPSTLADMIAATAPDLAVVFFGDHLRIIGTIPPTAPVAASAATVRPVVNSMLIDRALSAEHISICEHDGRRFIAAHN